MRSRFLIAIAVVLGMASPAWAGDDERVKAGFDSLTSLKPLPAVHALTAPFIEAMRAGTPAARANAARYIMLIGQAFAIDGNISSYLSCAKMALLLQPGDPTAIAFNIQAYIRASKFLEAETLARQWDKLASSSSYFARSASDAYRLNSGDAAKADEYLKRAVVLDSKDAMAWALLGKNCTVPKQAQEYFVKAASCVPEGAYRREVWLWNAERSVHQGVSNTEHLENAGRILPDEPGWKVSKAFYLISQGQLDEGLKYYVSAVEAPNRLSLRALAQFATFCAYNGRPKTARAAADRVIEVAPDLPESYLCRAHMARQLGDLKGAEQDYLAALKVAPRFSLAYEALRDFPEYSNGKKAQWLAENWHKNCPEKPEPWILLADRKRLDGKFADAMADYEVALERLRLSRRPPEKSMLTECHIYAGKGTCAYKMGDMKLANECAGKFNERKPSTAGEFMPVRLGKIDFSKLKGDEAKAAEHAVLADILYQGGQFDDCIVEYKQAIALKDNPEWHRGLLKAYMDKHDYKSAINEDIVVSHNTVTKDLPGALDKLRKQFGR